jgi:hypothetical protein
VEKVAGWLLYVGEAHNCMYHDSFSVIDRSFVSGHNSTIDVCFICPQRFDRQQDVSRVHVLIKTLVHRPAAERDWSSRRVGHDVWKGCQIFFLFSSFLQLIRRFTDPCTYIDDSSQCHTEPTAIYYYQLVGILGYYI